MTRAPAAILGFLILLAAIVLSAWAYPLLPDSVPTHWDLAGQVNGYSSRLFAVSFMPAIVAFMWLLMLVLPSISPRGFSLDASLGSFNVAMLAVMAFMFLVQGVLLRSAITHVMPSLALLFGLIGALLIVLGVLTAKAKKNFWFGVRTPWALASHQVWTRTNRFGGRLMATGGIIIVLASFFPAVTIPVLVAMIVVIGSVPIVYSYVVYRRIEGFDSKP